LKARLTEAAIAFPKTHDLAVLLKLAVVIEPMWAVMASQMSVVTDWAVLPRYPGTSAAAADAKEAAAICRRFRQSARQALGL
jgi:HEPN domain-containing protein